MAANRLAGEADLVIGVGTRLGDFTTCSKWLFKNPEVEFLTLNVNGFDAYKMDSNPIVADAREALKGIANALKKRGYRSGYEESYIKEVKDEWNREVQKLFRDERKEGLSQTRVIGELDALLEPDDIVIGSSGSLPGCLQRI